MKFTKKSFKAVKALITTACIIVSTVFSSVPVSAASYGSVKEGAYFISLASDTTKCIDGAGGEKIDNWGSYDMNVHLWDNLNICTADDYNNQIWDIEYIKKVDGKAYYRIVNRLTGYVLDVSGGIAENGRNVQEYEYNGTDAQMWRFDKCSDGSYVIVSLLSHGAYALDIENGSTENGANCQIYSRYSWEGNSAQKFVLRAADKQTARKIGAEPVYYIYQCTCDCSIFDKPSFYNSGRYGMIGMGSILTTDYSLVDLTDPNEESFWHCLYAGNDAWIHVGSTQYVKTVW
ncbi:MAG: RICIN domain-containing protein [Ruminococcus flavefaciens]|nr:RICIN domain-containing protein [Ruminococcus flavefaciens]MCM1380759.1 RICIN domain-containing protein [Muribaculaceae bacterium]MCM1479393.1 RICIN domain-containing protein [Muribaculaceae bacterium]